MRAGNFWIRTILGIDIALQLFMLVINRKPCDDHLHYWGEVARNFSQTSPMMLL